MPSAKWRLFCLGLNELNAGRGSAETCGLDYVFPHDDLGSSLYTQFIIIYIPWIIAPF